MRGTQPAEVPGLPVLGGVSGTTIGPFWPATFSWMCAATGVPIWSTMIEKQIWLGPTITTDAVPKPS
jgi:hypothetical protein